MVSVISAGLLLLVYGETKFHLVGAAARLAGLFLRAHCLVRLPGAQGVLCCAVSLLPSVPMPAAGAAPPAHLLTCPRMDGFIPRPPRPAPALCCLLTTARRLAPPGRWASFWS